MDHSERISKLALIGRTFSPGAPIDQKTLFAGRFDELRDAINVVTQRGQHAVIFGERGVGKTSLANIVLEIFGDQVNKPACGPINCDKTMDFSKLWHTVLREMHTEKGTLNDLVGKLITPDDIRHLLQNVSRTLIVLDEVDRLKDDGVTTQLADTIKNLSDHSLDTTIVLVGVADSVESLISEHKSIERNILQIRMPPMAIKELTEIVEKGAQLTKMDIEPNAKIRIAKLSQGLPHYTHLLCLHAFQAAIDRDSLEVSMADVRTAIGRALSKAIQTVVSTYNKAISSPRKDNLYAQVLLACALAQKDSLGYFFAGDVRPPMKWIMKKDYSIAAFSQHLNAFCEDDRGPILKRVGSKRKYRFRFVEPIMQPYIVMNGISSGLIGEDQIPIDHSQEAGSEEPDFFAT